MPFSFPYIFRGALDVRASEINDAMKLAAAQAIAALTREPVPESVLRDNNLERLEFGRGYLIPKPTSFILSESLSNSPSMTAQ